MKKSTVLIISILFANPSNLIAGKIDTINELKEECGLTEMEILSPDKLLYNLSKDEYIKKMRNASSSCILKFLKFGSHQNMIPTVKRYVMKLIKMDNSLTKYEILNHEAFYPSWTKILKKELNITYTEEELIERCKEPYSAPESYPYYKHYPTAKELSECIKSIEKNSAFIEQD